MAWGIVSSRDAMRDPVVAARARLALLFAALYGLLLLVTGGIAYAFAERTLLSAFDGAHDLAIRSILENVEPAAPEPRVRQGELAEEVTELHATLGVIAAKVWSQDGRPLGEAGTDATTLAFDGPARELRGSGPSLSIVRRAAFGAGSEGGVVVVSRRAAELGRDLEALRRGLFFALPLGLIVALGIGWTMAGRSLRPLRQAFHQQRAFMTDASHEIRTPLSIMRAQAEAHLVSDASEAGLRSALAVVARTSSQLGVLLDDLLLLARADASAPALRGTRFDIEALVEETVESFGPLASKRDARVVVVRSQELELQADPAQIRRLVTILIDNALKYTAGDIEVALERLGRNVELRVDDGGPGIPAELLPRVFDRFVRGESAREAHGGGHGLGLALAKSIVSAHGGAIALRANERGGTSAIVTLPLH